MPAVLFTYPAILTPEEEGGFLVRFRDLPEAITQGENVADALYQAADCLDEAIAGRIKRDDPLPLPSAPRKRERLVAPPVRTAAQAALYLAMRELGISKSELARRLGRDEKSARLLLDPRHPSKIDSIEAALAVLGCGLEVGLRKIA